MTRHDRHKRHVDPALSVPRPRENGKSFNWHPGEMAFRPHARRRLGEPAKPLDRLFAALRSAE
jgi:hypothetical protein